MEHDAREEIEDALSHIIPREPYPQFIDDTVYLEISELLKQHPDKALRAWDEKPRLYALLRMLGYHDDTPAFQRFDSEQINDFWLPLNSTTLSHISSSVGISTQDWRRAERHALSKPEWMNEEKLLSPVHSHRYIRHGTSHFEELEQIGRGGSAEVVRVRHKLSGKQFACKRILRADTLKLQRMQLVEFEQEVGVLQRINHPHLVSFVASFTDLVSFSLILNPVAKDVLKSMLDRQSRDQPLLETDISILRRAFGCLATAISYLHEQRVRHKDIKPANILLSDGSVYLCDFGISRDWSKNDHSTTEGDVMKFTRRYCAPEVFGRDPRNTKSDIWSLGCVFLEILSVVKGYTLEEVNNFLLENSVGASAQGLWCAPEAVSAWLAKIRSEKSDSADDIPLDWIIPMIRTEAEDRLKASELVDMIQKQSLGLPQSDLFMGPCCSRADSIAPIDVVDSPTLHYPMFSGLGINNSSVSPPRPSLLDLPYRNISPSSIDRRNNPPPSRHRSSQGSRDRSISPHTSALDPRDSTETGPFQMDPGSDGRSEFLQTLQSNRALRYIASRSDSQRTSEFFIPHVPESEVSSSSFQRSPVPPPANFEVKCGCAAVSDEKHIFNASYASAALENSNISNAPFQFDPDVATIETCSKCEMRENKVQIYETLPQNLDPSSSHMPMIWRVTRRLVVSYLSGNPEMRHCSSFWLPLADTQFELSGNAVTLRWSDCNQMTERHSGNYGQHYDWIYDHKTPNNHITLQFNNIMDAGQFIDIIRLPYEDGVTVSRGKRIEMSNGSEVNIFDVGRPGARNYRIATHTTVSSGIGTSKLYILWPQVDLDIQIYDSKVNRSTALPNYQMIIAMKNVSTPTYHSDVRGEPAADYERVARFSRALQLKVNMIVTFPIGMHHNLPVPPSGASDMLRGLTGWTPCYFAIVTKFKSKNKRFGSKKYGPADVMLWSKDVDNTITSSRKCEFAVTFRLHEDAEHLWISGTITYSTSISYSTGFDASVTVSKKARGKLLDLSRMTAIMSEDSAKEPTHSRSLSDTHEDHSDLVLTFESARYRLEFVKLIEEFKAASSSASPVRRINSLASNDAQWSPPMR